MIRAAIRRVRVYLHFLRIASWHNLLTVLWIRKRTLLVTPREAREQVEYRLLNFLIKLELYGG